MRSIEIFFFFPDEKLERERVGKKEKGRKEKKNHFLFNQWIILREKNVWSCYNNCYSALLFERAIVAALKKYFEFREAIGGRFLCVCSPKLAAYWRCSYITEQSFFFQAFGIQHKNYDLCLQLKLLSTQLGLELNIELDLTHNAAPKVD